MGMDWKDNTVSMGLVDKEKFESKLGTVIVSERRIAVDPNDVEDWERIFRELGEGTVLEEVRWEEVEDVSKTIEDLYYPHINVRFRRQSSDDEAVFEDERERRIFFTQDETEELEKCFKAIRKFWNQWRQYKATNDDRFPDEIESDVEEEVELQEALQTSAEDGDESDEPAAAAAADQREGPAPETAAASEPDQPDTIESSEEQPEAADMEQVERPEEPGEPDDASDEEEDDDDLDDIVDRFMEE